MTQRDDFVRCAREQVGKRYVWATAGPDTFDCSGLVAYCYQRATGKAITRSSHEQARLGKPVFENETLMPGDFLFWGDADHVGIHVGDGDVVNALNEQRGVVISKSNADYGMPYMQTRSIWTDKHSGYSEIHPPVFLPADSPIVEEPDTPEEPRPKARRRRKRRKDRA